MTFTPTSHAYVGTSRAYLPQGFAPYAHPATPDPEVILAPGHVVDVLSAWTRDYLPPSAPILLFVRSHATGAYIHVPAYDLPMAT